MSRQKQIKKLVELIRAVHDVQIDMAADGFAIENYPKIMDNFQKRYYVLRGRYYQIRKTVHCNVKGSFRSDKINFQFFQFIT